MSSSRKSLGNEGPLFMTRVMTSLYIPIVILNLFLPLFSPKSMGITSLFQWVVILIHLKGYLNGIGGIPNLLHMTKQSIPFISLFVIRSLEILYYTLVSRTKFNFVPLVALLILDLVFIVILFIDKRDWEYNKVSYRRNRNGIN